MATITLISLLLTLSADREGGILWQIRATPVRTFTIIATYVAVSVGLTVAGRLMNYVRRPRTETLSARERAVLQLVARGMSNRKVGHELHISEATVKTHLVHLFQKLEVADRTTAVTIAVERGLIHIGRA